MPRINEINSRFSALPQSGKHIVYLVTEDRDILEEVFSGAAPMLKGLGGRAFTDCITAPEQFYRYCMTNRLLADLYALLPLGQEYFPRPCGEQLDKATFYYLNDFHILQPAVAAHLIKQFIAYAAQRAQNDRPAYLLLLSPLLRLPEGFQHEIEIIDVPELDESDILALLRREAVKECFPQTPPSLPPLEQPLDAIDLQRIARAAQDFKGLPRQEILVSIRELQSEFGSFYGRNGVANGKMDNLQRIQAARTALVQTRKRQAASHDSTITLLDAHAAVEGMDGYRSWLAEIRQDMLSPSQAGAWGSLPPKGVLLTGIPGSGKTQAAKMTAASMGVSLVQFRMDNLLGGLVGDSESNFKRCRKRVEALAPCVVLIDELEKIFGADEGAGSHEVKMHLLAALLDWLQENRKAIFFFATSNSVHKLRPELLRDGRFDMRFCVFMPTRDELLPIFRLHMQRVNALSGGRLFARFAEEYTLLAREFLTEITAYARQTGKDMFYTGANIESLIIQTNRRLRSLRAGEPDFGRGAYLDALLETAKSGRSQPYGVTNMHEIASFWLLARRNQYAPAGGLDLFPFSGFDEEKSAFTQVVQTDNEYDKYLVQRVSAEICKLHRQQKAAQNGQRET